MSELERAKLALEKATKEYDRRQAQWQKILDNRNPRPKLKAGRPSIWRSETGRQFVQAVLKIQVEHKCKVSMAIKKVLKDPRMAALKNRYKDKWRTLEVRYQEASDFWCGPFGRAHKDFIASAALERARNEMLLARERVEKAFQQSIRATIFRNTK
jgi:hypothetical protein